MHCAAVDIPKDRHAQVEPFDLAADLTSFDDVTNSELPLQNDKESTDYILDQALGPEADGQPYDASAGDDGSDVQPEFPKTHHRGNDNDRRRPDRLDDAGQRQGALFPLADSAGSSLYDGSDHTICGQLEEADQDQAPHGDDRQAEAAGPKPAQDLLECDSAHLIKQITRLGH